MNIVICGAGEVGRHAAETLAPAGHAVTVIDIDPGALRIVSETMDVATLAGNCAEAGCLVEAGAADADMVVAATDRDEVNLLTAAVAKQVGARKSIARVHHIDYFENPRLNYGAHFHIDHLICPEYSTSTAIARSLRNPAAIAIEHFARGKIEMQELPVDDDAVALGKPLAQLALPRGTRLASVARGNQVFIPHAETEIQKGDRVVLVGNSDAFYEARDLFQKEHGSRRKVVIMGGVPMAVWLCRALRDRAWSIRLFETDGERANDLAERLSWVTVIQADPTDRGVFAEERLGLADVFIAMLDDDEANIISCVLAKTMGVPRVMAVVNRATYLDLLYHIGVDQPFSPRRVAVEEIEHILDEGSLRLIAALGEGTIDAYRLKIVRNARASGKPLKDIKLAPNWVVAAIRRDERVWVPSAEDTEHPLCHLARRPADHAPERHHAHDGGDLLPRAGAQRHPARSRRPLRALCHRRPGADRGHGDVAPDAPRLALPGSA
jgi:trk system potassium uptake protein TrkA